ncbi:hypothetical protein FZEAL_4807 [Fusarium zealandicum]|uniref:Uncharacterized protein n=1 Tax=Fusarium zealandicum TaxID=1053134 RepID=A0A8H4ULT3_9HYPO|nr:hypothetical protein FZEAL_4807 [Fusarium zealandicum]
MHYTTIAALLSLAGCAVADLHNIAVCVTDRKMGHVGGTPWSVSYTWSKNYEMLPDATKCACEAYKRRNQGDEQWNTCPDCSFDGTYCNSVDWHIGGKEMNYYCTKICGAQGSEAN